MTYLITSCLVTAIILAMLVYAAKNRRRRRINLILDVAMFIGHVDPHYKKDASGYKHVKFTVKPAGASTEWNLYFDAGRERFELDNPYTKGHCLLAPINSDFPLTEDNLRRWLSESTAIQNFRPTPPPRSKSVAEAA